MAPAPVTTTCPQADTRPGVKVTGDSRSQEHGGTGTREHVLTPQLGTSHGRVPTLQARGCCPGLCKFWRCWRSPWARSSSSLTRSYFYPLSGKALAGERDGGCYN